jgi:hypothetical protein
MRPSIRASQANPKGVVVRGHRGHLVQQRLAQERFKAMLRPEHPRTVVHETVEGDHLARAKKQGNAGMKATDARVRWQDPLARWLTLTSGCHG